MQGRILSAFLLIFASGWNETSFAAVGRTVGTFGVSPIGSAQYTIAIWNPPGIHNLQPSLALSYDSSLSYGIMGPGWTLSGLTAITRCNPTYAQDGTPEPITLTAADGLCLDGNRLRTTGTGVYQTEIANFSQVTASSTQAGNGPAYFTVQAKNGLTYEYGNTTDSRVFSAQGVTTPYTWALDKVTDRAGNAITYTYTQAGGTYVLKSITYGPASNQYTISFTYSTLQSTSPSILSHFVAGTQVQQTQQLSNITVAVGTASTTLRAYNLLYSTSSATLRATLTSIQECGNSSGSGTSATDCLLATTVGYQAGTAGIANPTTASGSGSTNGTVYSVDIDGDGKQDLVYAVTSGSNFQWWVQLGTANGYGSPINSGAVTPGNTDLLLDDFDASGATELLAPVSGVFWAYKWNGSGFSSTSTHISVLNGVTYSSADVDGDGRPDLVNIQTSSTASTINIGFQLNTSASGSISFVSTPVTQALPLGAVLKMQMYGNNQLVNSSVKHYDFDGDGRQDVLLYYTSTINSTTWTTLYPLLSRGTGQPPLSMGAISSPGTVTQLMALNWNDDNCTDLSLGLVIGISPCNSNSGVQISLAETPVAAVDWDGDGRTDILTQKIGQSTLDLIRSQGYQAATAVSTSITVAKPGYYVVNGTYVVTDQNGDGLDDLVTINTSASDAIAYGLHGGAGLKPDLAISFVDGFGNTFSPSYVSIADSPIYFEYSDAAFPYQNYVGPLYVVNSTTFSDPSMNGGTYLLSYYYAGAWWNLQGRGFSAFQSIQHLDSRNSVWETSFYDRAFPTNGMVNYHRLAQDNVGTVAIDNKAMTTSYSTLISTANDQSYFPYILNSFDQAYEVQIGGQRNGQLITTTQTNFTYDGYGNAVNVATTITDADASSPFYNDTWTSTVAETISPNTADWCLGLPTQTTVTNSSTAPSGAALTRTTTYTPDYANCRETVKTTEPTANGGIYKVVETYGYDSFGNINSDSIAGYGMGARTTSVSWGTTGQFPTTITYPLTPPITLTFDTSTGMQTSQTDPNYTTSNPLTTSWTYDDFARPMKETRPDGTYTTWTYNDCASWGGCLFGSHSLAIAHYIYGSNGSLINDGTTWFDQLDRYLMAEKAILQGAARNEVRYDSLGRVAQQAMPCLYSTVAATCPYWQSLTYDILNRVTQLQRPISATKSAAQTTYIGYSGRTTTLEDALTNTTTKINLVTGSLAQSKDAKGYYQTFSYDAFGSLLKVTDSASNTLFGPAVYAYGIDAFQTSSSDMDSGARSYTVDALGEVTGYTDAKSQSFTQTYDALGRPGVRTEPDSPSGNFVTTWNWGTSASSYNVGKLQSVTAAGYVGTYTDTYAYDSKTRLSTDTKQLPGDSTYTYTYTYSPTTGLLNTLQYPISTASYQLSLQYGYSNGILSSITDTQAGTVYWTANATNARGQVTQETLGNGVVTNRAYDPVTSWVGSIQSGLSGGAGLQNNAFTYDEVGNVTQRQDNNQGLTENFYYDTDYRLDHSTLGGTVNLQLTYDSLGMGNIASRSDVAGGTAWTYDPVRKHAVTQAGTGGYSYTYDGNGNAITRNGYAIGWTSYNYLSAVSSSGESASFWYGPDRQRWKTQYTGSIGTETTYHVGKLLEKVALGGNLDYRHYIFAGNEQVAIVSRQSNGTNAVHYMLEDHQSSYAAIVNSAGTLEVNESFTAYGNRRSGESWSGPPTTADETAINNVSRQGYTGQTALGVSMGLNHMNGRVQDAITGRFLSPDPFIPDPENTQSFNRYSYVNNNPLSFFDPSGFDSCDDPDGLCEIVPGGQYMNPQLDDVTVTAPKGSTAEWGPILGQIQVTIPGQAVPTLIALSGPTNNKSVSKGNFLPAGSITAAQSQTPPLQDIVVTAQRPPQVQAASMLPEIIVTAPYPTRLFGTHWCGPGGGGPPVNDLDAACQSHDNCYDSIGFSASSNFNNLSATDAANVQACNQLLCNAARQSSAPGSTRVNLYFSTLVNSNVACH